MLRILFFFIVVCALSLTGVWMLEHNGSLTLDWLGYRIEASLFFIVSIVLVAFIIMLLLVLALLWLRAAPHRVAAHYSDVKRDKGMVALTQGFAAIAAGDIKLAKRLAKQANGKLGKTPLTLLLHTQTAQLNGDDKEAKYYLAHLLENKETEIIALKGMLLQAKKESDLPEAIRLAERAYELNPNAAWIVPVLTDLYKHARAWDKARRMLEETANRKALSSEEHNRMLGILLLSEAREKLQAEQLDDALKFSYRANKFLPGFAPAAVTLAAILLKLGKKRKAVKMLEQHWETLPHPGLAKSYLEIYAEEPVDKQLKHIERLASRKENSPESHRVIARQALLADNISKARNHLKLLLQSTPTVSTYQMMYDLEKKEGGQSVEALQGWIEKAAKAEQDAAWVCNSCGYSVKEDWNWNPICQNCDSFDSFQWKEASTVHVLTMV